MNVDTLITNIVKQIVNPTITLIFTAGLIYFLYGMYKYVKGAEDATARKEGMSHIIWGLAGMFVMMSAFALIRITLNTFGVEIPSTLK